MTTTYSKRMTEERYTQVQYDAETRQIEREVAQPWPAFDSIQRVIVRGLSYEPETVMIDIVDGHSYVTSRARNAQDALAEIVGYWNQAGNGLVIHPDTPEGVREYLQAVAA